MPKGRHQGTNLKTSHKFGKPVIEYIKTVKDKIGNKL